MLLTMTQSKYLESDGKSKQFRFNGQGKATDQEKQKLKELDDSYIDLHGEHLITNYDDLN